MPKVGDLGKNFECLYLICEVLTLIKGESENPASGFIWAFETVNKRILDTKWL